MSRITFVLPHAGLSGGVRVVAIYAEALRKRGWHVSAVSWPRPQPSLRRRVKGVLRGEGWNAGRPKTEGSHLDGVVDDHTVLDRPRPVTDADLPDADVVVATFWPTAEAVSGLSPAKGAPVYLVQHDERVISPGQEERVAATYRLPIAKVAVADWLGQMLRDEFGDAEAEVVPNAVDAERFQAPPRGKAAAPTVGLMCAPTHFKGCDVSLAAFDMAKRDVPDLRLVAFGGQAPTPELPLPAESDFVLRPDPETMNRVYASADAWLFGSRIEGFGLPILEAMACRTPVIATRAGAAPDLAPPGGGWLVDVDDAPAMARAIVACAGLSSEAWSERSERARAVASGWTWEHAADRFEAAVRRAAERHTAGAGASGGTPSAGGAGA
ncbi:MAG: glycosyltransferase family 4 protein [Planctomycetota bacterium]